MTDILIEIFKTNVTDKQASKKVLHLLENSYPHLKINFDLDDCDKVLRIQGSYFSPNLIIELLLKMGYSCERME
jgi:tRNA G26 N,N-dimethylase Trm1